MPVEACIQCDRTADELAPPAILLTRPRPLGPGHYQICFGCAKKIKKEQDERAQVAIGVAERAGA